MRKFPNVLLNEVDELAFPQFTPVSKPVAFAHPAMFIMHRVIQARTDLHGNFRWEYFEWWKNHFKKLIGIDVADSDRMSRLAVDILNMYDELIVPSTFCKHVYESSGVKRKVHVVPHGVDPEWYEMPNLWETVPPASISPAILHVYLYKLRTRRKIILFWLWHSGQRKGWNEVRQFYEKIRKERDDVILVLKTGIANPIEYQQVMHLGCINIYGWISETDKLALYDIADLVLVFSRGGGFELNALEALARGVPVLTVDWGCFLDYVPPYLRCKKGRRVQPLPGNKLHVGYGYAVDVEDAVNKAHHILDNLDEYRAKVNEWREKVLKKRFRWDVIARMLIEIAKSE